jgi:hypothetical protein
LWSRSACNFSYRITFKFSYHKTAKSYISKQSSLTIIYSPQRFQVVNGLSPIDSGVRFLALTLASSVSVLIAGIFTQKLRVPFPYVLVAAALLQIVGLALLGHLSADHEIQRRVYRYQVILGLSLGSILSTSVILVPGVVEKKDLGEMFLFYLVL